MRSGVDAKIEAKFKYFENIDKQVAEFTYSKGFDIKNYPQTHNHNNTAIISSPTKNKIRLNNAQIKSSNSSFYDDNFTSTKGTSDTFSNFKFYDKKRKMRNSSVEINNSKTVTLSQKSLDIGERLYNNVKSIEEKMSQTRGKINSEHSFSYTPILSPYANKVMRDPAQFPLRLYPAHQIEAKERNSNNRTRNKSFNLSSGTNYLSKSVKSIQLDESRIYLRSKDKTSYYDQWNYQPSLNRTSLRIAEKLGNSFERLTKKKKTENFISSTENNLINNLRILSKSTANLNFNSNTLGHSLYYRAQKSLDKKKDKIKLNQMTVSKAFLEFPYSPDMSLSRGFNSSLPKNEKTKKHYERVMLWEKQRNMKNEKLRTLFNDQFKFQPTLIAKEEIRDDEKFISKQLNHIMTYVSRKQRAIEMKKKKEDLSSRFYEKGKYYRVKPTVTKEFNLSCSQDCVQVKNPVYNISKLRHDLKTNDFFNEKIPDNNQSINDSSMLLPLSTNQHLTENQLLEAVGYLHKQLQHFK
jgi:hypothetical protein